MSLFNPRFRTSDADQSETSLASKRSNCHALASTPQKHNRASARFDESDAAPPSNTQGALSEQRTSWLSQARSCVSHLGEIKTPAAEMNNFKAESLPETILYAAESISAGFCSACSERMINVWMSLPTTAVPGLPGETLPPKRWLEMYGGISGCRNQRKEYYWYQVSRGQGCCKTYRLPLHNKELSNLKCQ